MLLRSQLKPWRLSWLVGLLLQQTINQLTVGSSWFQWHTVIVKSSLLAGMKWHLECLCGNHIWWSTIIYQNHSCISIITVITTLVNTIEMLACCCEWMLYVELSTSMKTYEGMVKICWILFGPAVWNTMCRWIQTWTLLCHDGRCIVLSKRWKPNI